MSTAAVMTGTSSSRQSPRVTARWAGFFWLMTIVAGVASMAFAGQLAIAVNLIASATYAAATVLVYRLMKPVNQRISLLAAAFSLVGCVFGSLNLFLDLGPRSATAQFLFFGVHCFLVGYLILRSTFISRIVGALLAFGGLGWLTLGVVGVVAPALARPMFPFLMAPGVLGETSLTLWLLVVGVNVERWHRQAAAAAARELS